MIESPPRQSYSTSERPFKMSSESKTNGARIEIRPISPTKSRFDTETSLHKRLTEEAVTYFEGPRDIQRHSKLPLFMRLNGGILPKMILPLAFAGSWATGVMLIHTYVVDIGVDTVLLTVLGFVVAFAVTFRSSTAYERYSEGRRYWSSLILTSRNLGRHVWINMAEREDEEDPLRVKKDLLGKISAMNLIAAFSVALMHRLRFEPGVNYPDVQHLVAPIAKTTLAGKADQSKLEPEQLSTLKRLGQYLGLSFAFSNPRKMIKRSEDNLGNLPHEILVHISSYFEKAMASKQIYGPNKFFWSDVRLMAEILTGVERISTTPLPIAYTICIAQITWLYILALPFQLARKLGWVTIPATMLAAYIILGLATIGAEIEDPFGNDVNDLPLERYCAEIRGDLDTIMSHTVDEYEAYTNADCNRPLFPLSGKSTTEWLNLDMTEVRELLKKQAEGSHLRRRNTGFLAEEV